MAAAPPVRPQRASATRRRWADVKTAVDAALTLMATRTRDNLTIAPGPVAPGIVRSSITGGALPAPVTGDYSSGSMSHAEISAIDSLGAANWAQPLTISTNKEPCPRCAAILAVFVATHGWTVHAPAQTFATNYGAAYSFSDNVFNLVIAYLSAPGGAPAIMGDEATHFATKLKSFLLGFGVT